jgi:uncharacterized protein (TIGR03083 family)
VTRLDELLAAYDAQSESLLDWLRAVPPETAERESRLAGWSVRELAFHLTEVPRALTAALARPASKERALTIADYTAHWRTVAGDIAERDRSAAISYDLPAVITRYESESAAMRSAVAAMSRDVVVSARRGPIRLTDFLTTRVNELVVHSLDLTASTPERDPVAIDRQALGVACRMLAGILAERVPGHTVEVRVPPYSAVQCVEGPRHTRGTPPNVVEVDAMAWIEIATGRLSWHAALGDGRLRISGERADISEHLPVLS